MIPAHTLDAARAVRIEDEIARRGIKLSAGRAERYGPCPVCCDGTDRFAINLKKQVFNCRQCGGKGGGSIDLVMFLDGCDFNAAVKSLAGEASQRTDFSIRKPNDNQSLALALWRASADPRGTLVEKYLKSRALELSREAAGEAIRFHPDCPFWFERFPATICLVRNILTNEPQAIHRTALMPDGTAVKRNGKTFRLSLGPIAGGAIKLDPEKDVTRHLCIGEGVETTLSARQLGLRPVWSAVSVGGIENFQVLPGIDRIHIIRENDANGASARAVKKCADRWFEAGREVFIVASDVGNDLNDELRGGIQ